MIHGFHNSYSTVKVFQQVESESDEVCCTDRGSDRYIEQFGYKISWKWDQCNMGEYIKMDVKM